LKIGLIVDGEAEFRSLPRILSRISTTNTLINPLYADIQPYASVPQIVGVIKKKLNILSAKRVELALILVDLENKPDCPGDWAGQIEQACIKDCAHSGISRFAVVIKKTCYENWLIADTTAFDKSPKRFKFTDALRRSIEPDRADNVDAQKVMQSIVQGRAYDKVADAMRIMEKAEPLRIGENSRSFRRFLRVLETSEYKTQSKKPAKQA
jgi:hypothetical protein